MFKEVADEGYFRQDRAEGGTVVWPHEQDICPDTVYLDSKRQFQQSASNNTLVE